MVRKHKPSHIFGRKHCARIKPPVVVCHERADTIILQTQFIVTHHSLAEFAKNTFKKSGIFIQHKTHIFIAYCCHHVLQNPAWAKNNHFHSFRQKLFAGRKAPVLRSVRIHKRIRFQGIPIPNHKPLPFRFMRIIERACVQRDIVIPGRLHGADIHLIMKRTIPVTAAL